MLTFNIIRARVLPNNRARARIFYPSCKYFCKKSSLHGHDPNSVLDKTSTSNERRIENSEQEFKPNTESRYQKDIESTKIITKINNAIDEGIIHEMDGNEATKLKVLPKDSVSGYRRITKKIINSVNARKSEKQKEEIFELRKFYDKAITNFVLIRRLPKVAEKLNINESDVANIASVTLFRFLKVLSINPSSTYLNMSLELGDSVMKLLAGRTEGLFLDNNIKVDIKLSVDDWEKKHIVSVGMYLLTTLAKIEYDFGTGHSRPIVTLQAEKVGKNKLLGKVFADDELLSKLFDDQIILKAALKPTIHAMEKKPNDWTNTEDGGFELYRQSVLKTHTPIQTENLKGNGGSEKLNSVLNALQGVPWAINKKILDVVKKIHDNGYNIAGIVKMPEKVILEEFSKSDDDPDSKGKVYLNYRLKKERLDKEFASQNSKYYDTNLKLICIEEMSNKGFYFPYNADIRGRVYPIVPHLHHFQNDVSRGLLLFEEKKAIGTNGLRNLKVQVANLFGKDKISLDDRVKWVEEQIENNNIKNNAELPIEFKKGSKDVLKKWWCEADKPIQFLAAIIELNEALKLDKPEKYASGLPLHKDGSCNGLQHYSALIRDETLGSKVNLVDNEVPADIYSDVKNEVIAENNLLLEYFNYRIYEEDRHELYSSHNRQSSSISRLSLNAEVYSTPEDPNHIIELVKKIGHNSEERKKIKLNDCYIAWLLQGKITRKVIKQSVMTIPYGVTMIGASDQIEERLAELNASIKEKHGNEGPSSDIVKANAALEEPIPTDTMLLTEQEIKKVSLRLAQQVLASKNFEKAKYVMNLLKEISKEVVKYKKDSHKDGGMEWISALDVPVLQDYRKKVAYTARVNGKSVTYVVGSSLEPNTRKESDAFPPNFVHSIDAAHMGETCLALYKEGITFTAVHDSFWTHACDVNRMEEVLRDTFIKIHEQKLLRKLLNDSQRLTENSLKSIGFPEEGDLDLNEIRKSTYFFN